jgi:hypothetical protein
LVLSVKIKLKPFFPAKEETLLRNISSISFDNHSIQALSRHHIEKRFVLKAGGRVEGIESRECLSTLSFLFRLTYL